MLYLAQIFYTYTNIYWPKISGSDKLVIYGPKLSGQDKGSEEHCIRSVISSSNRESNYFFEHTLCCHQPLSSPHTNQQHTISCYLLYTRRRRGPSLVFLFPSSSLPLPLPTPSHACVGWVCVCRAG